MVSLLWSPYNRVVWSLTYDVQQITKVQLITAWLSWFFLKKTSLFLVGFKKKTPFRAEQKKLHVDSTQGGPFPKISYIEVYITPTNGLVSKWVCLGWNFTPDGRWGYFTPVSHHWVFFRSTNRKSIDSYLWFEAKWFSRAAWNGRIVAKSHHRNFERCASDWPAIW